MPGHLSKLVHAGPPFLPAPLEELDEEADDDDDEEEANEEKAAAEADCSSPATKPGAAGLAAATGILAIC
jgi:hypothetical protein